MSHQITTGDDLLLVIDTETTGLDVGQHSVIEFGAALYDVNSGTIVTVFSTLIYASENPAEVINHIPQAALELEVSRRPDLNQIIKMFSQARWIVAHNVSFDQPMVEKLFLDHSVVVANRPWVCSRMQLQFPKATSSRKLGHLAVDHGIEVSGAHRAIADVLILCRLLQQLPDLRQQLNDALIPRRLYAAGVTYEKRQIAKDQGFQFCGQTKQWRKQLTSDEAADLPFAVYTVDGP